MNPKGEEVDYLDCCDKPRLGTIRSLYSSGHDAEALRQCRNCGGYWLYRFNEYITWVGDDDITVWYTPLTPQEGKDILDAMARPDLSFLEERECFMKDKSGIRRVQGQPGLPLS